MLPPQGTGLNPDAIREGGYINIILRGHTREIIASL